MLIVLVVVILLIAFEVYTYAGREQKLSRALREAEGELERIRAEKEMLGKELEYLSHPENFEKELRARFNYREPGEKLIIIVPGGNASATFSP